MAAEQTTVPSAADIDDQPEFSRPIQVGAIPREGLVRRIEATAAERGALAHRFGLERLESLNADLVLRRSGDGRVRVRGTLHAAVVQTCVVTLEPVAADLTDRFAASFVPPHLLAEDDAPAPEVIVSITDGGSVEEDDPEPFLEDDRIDIGELTAQHLSLALDPYPRAPGAVLLDAAGDPDGVEAPDTADVQTPFRALAARLGRETD